MELAVRRHRCQDLPKRVNISLSLRGEMILSMMGWHGGPPWKRSGDGGTLPHQLWKEAGACR